MKSLGWPLSKKAGLAWSMRWRRDIGKLHDWQVSGNNQQKALKFHKIYQRIHRDNDKRQCNTRELMK
jgi:hypothetical protein